MDKLNGQQISEAGLVDWRHLAQGLHTRYRAEDSVAAAAFVTEVAQLGEADGHHPELRLSRGLIDVSLATRENGIWITRKDIEMAGKITAIAARAGLEPRATAVIQLEIALDTAYEDRVAPFWSVLLTGSPANRVDDSVLDPTGRIPSVWFQGTEDQEADRQRWHFDLWLAPEVAEERIAAAVAAGGSVVDDSKAPSFTVLSDSDGNRV